MRGNSVGNSAAASEMSQCKVSNSTVEDSAKSATALLKKEII